MRFKKAQLTIFIIFGIILVATIVFLFLLYGPELNILRQKTSSPVEYLTICVEDAIKESEKNFFENGFLKGSTLNYKYKLQTIPFLCYSTEFYMPCVPQNPLFIEAIRKKMENFVSRELSRCVLTLKEDYEKRGYLFGHSNFELSLAFNELEFFYSAKMNINISKGGKAILVSTREGSIPSSLPKLLRTAETIVNYETSFCEFNHIAWQASNKDIRIERFRGGDQTKVYSLGHRNSEEKIKFAIRTCVMPAGI